MIDNEVAKNWILLNSEIRILEDAYEKVDYLDRYEFLYELEDSMFFSFYQDKILRDYYAFKNSKNLKKSIKRKLQNLYCIKYRCKVQSLKNYIIDFRANIKLFVSTTLFINNDDESGTNLFPAYKLIKLSISVKNKLAIHEKYNTRLIKQPSF
ncbi:hypothetical protein ACFSQ3_04570 [Sphingobacterium corticis]|uniref:Uncharacterized protein n=1 Tax=Sphingobacterium corticis TaxID=1812823 RepID=A0ABW5NHR8_9SPHI